MYFNAVGISIVPNKCVPTITIDTLNGLFGRFVPRGISNCFMKKNA
jgi:hypothetical protein